MFNSIKKHFITPSRYGALILFGLLLLTGWTAGFDSQAINHSVFNSINSKRGSNSVKTLKRNSKLDSGAQLKLKDMIDNSYFDHTSPSGSPYTDFLKDPGYQFIIAGENLARGFYDAEGAVDAWMKSPRHRENLLDPRYSEVGVASAVFDNSGDISTYIVVIFADPPGSGTLSINKNFSYLWGRQDIRGVLMKNEILPFIVTSVVIALLVIVDSLMFSKVKEED